ncbi:hypothetical protein GE061_002814 [Apolygus lucorum]|uniref:Ionotropic glutamate receptor C-terminal domain-containing protein n=1 Tax=Apolygus lucorum TaxID=248454 RepID=A0A8S9X668_APOLU|nr:hypothetical protein GE061_002814 [Apolygus lucorum]
MSENDKKLFKYIFHLQPFLDLQQDISDFRTRFNIHLSIVYTFPYKMRSSCLAMASDSSYFAEKFSVEVSEAIPPIVLLDQRNRFKCDATLLVAENVHSLVKTLRQLPRFSTHRIWCLVNNNTLDELENYFIENLTDFGEASVFLMALGEYKVALRIAQPNWVLERIPFPHHKHKWPLIDNYIKAFSGKEIKYSTGNCNIHATYIPKLGSYWGLDWKVFEAVADGMELTTKFVELPPTSSVDVTGQYDNGTWKGGILGNLDNGLIDTGFCGFVVERKKFSKNIVLGNSIRDTCLLYAVLHPKPNSEDWSVIFYSFDPTVHLCLGISIISFAMIIQSIAHVDLFQSNSTSGFKSLGYSLSVAWGILMQGNFPNPWRMGTLRPFLFLWALFSILMTTSFSSHLVSNFARPPYHPKPRSVEDLVKFGYESPQIDSYPLSSIIDPDDPNSHEWLNRIYLVKDHSQLVDILDTKPLQALFGFKYDDDVFIPYAGALIPERVMEKYEAMDVCIATIYESFAFRRGTPFLKPFNDYTTNLLERGFLSKFTRDVLTQMSTLCPSLREATNSQQSKFIIDALSVFNLKGIFMVLIIGYIIATLTLIGEVIIHFEINRYKASNKLKSKIRFRH